MYYEFILSLSFSLICPRAKHIYFAKHKQELFVIPEPFCKLVLSISFSVFLSLVHSYPTTTITPQRNKDTRSNYSLAFPLGCSVGKFVNDTYTISLCRKMYQRLLGSLANLLVSKGIILADVILLRTLLL